MAILSVVCGSFLYYAYLSYHWGLANKPDTYKYPEVKYLIITVVGALYYTLQKKTIFAIFEPKMYNWC